MGHADMATPRRNRSGGRVIGRQFHLSTALRPAGEPPIRRPPRAWRGARAVDRGGLENRCACKRTVGSNPTLSAKGAFGHVLWGIWRPQGTAFAAASAPSRGRPTDVCLHRSPARSEDGFAKEGCGSGPTLVWNLSFRRFWKSGACTDASARSRSAVGRRYGARSQVAYEGGRPDHEPRGDNRSTTFACGTT